jgi:pimeloyl-ACP methyl ester carboxylesterase
MPTISRYPTEPMPIKAPKFERKFFQQPGCQLSYVDFGNAQLPDLVLLHGMQDHAMSMADIAHALSSHYHVVALDLRGHGHSDNPGIYTMVHYISDLHALAEHCQLQRPVIVAHSLGGHIASRYCALFAENVAKLVLLDGMGPPSIDDDPDNSLSKSRLRQAVLSVASQSRGGRQMQDSAEALHRLRRNNPKLSLALAQTIVDHGVQAHDDGGVCWRFDAAVQMIWNTFSFDESETVWSWIECPTLIVTGDRALDYWVNMRESLRGQEAFYQQTLLRRQQLFTDAKHLIIDDASHMLHYDQPHKLNQLLLDFLVPQRLEA